MSPRALLAGWAAPALLMAGAAGAQTCPVANADLTPALKAVPGVLAISLSRRRDPDSAEPVLRHAIDFGDGLTVVVEQQNCRIRNLRLTILSPRALPSPLDLKRAGLVLAATPTWRRYFARLNPAAMLAGEIASAQWKARAGTGHFGYSLDDRLSAAGESSEASLSFMRTDDDAVTYRSALALSISVGGI